MTEKRSLPISTKQEFLNMIFNRFNVISDTKTKLYTTANMVEMMCEAHEKAKTEMEDLESELRGTKELVEQLISEDKKALKSFKAEAEKIPEKLRTGKKLIMWECNKCGLFIDDNRQGCPVCKNDLFSNSTKRIMVRLIDVEQRISDMKSKEESE